MAQTSFLPIKLSNEEPYEGGTKDLALVGFTADRIRYAVKRESDGEFLPISEWIGHHLCRICQIPTPEFAVVECVNGEVAFGSRWEEGSRQISSAMPQSEALQLLIEHGTDIFAVHALDRFMVNPDRHAGNFLFVTRAGTRICLSMDFSMAGPRDGVPFGNHPLSLESKTYQIIRIVSPYVDELRARAAFLSTVDKLKNVTSTQFANILEAAPDAWFATLGRSDLQSWWDNHASSRLSDLES
jgi:hypothetical protein